MRSSSDFFMILQYFEYMCIFQKHRAKFVRAETPYLESSLQRAVAKKNAGHHLVLPHEMKRSDAPLQEKTWFQEVIYPEVKKKVL